MKKIDIESLERTNPYRVPDGYFSELKNNLRTASTEKETRGVGAWGRAWNMVGLFAAFGVLVVLATTGYYFTGHKATLIETEQNDPMLGYQITTYDLEALSLQLSDSSASQRLALAADEYLDTYGYGYIDSEALEVMVAEK